MRRKDLWAKSLTAVIAASMVTSICPITAFAVTGDQVAKDGIYTATKSLEYNDVAIEEEEEVEWDLYDVKVDLSVSNGIFSAIDVTPSEDYDSGNSSYFNKAVNKSKGIQTLLVGQPATEATINEWDTVAGATCTSEAVKEAALEAIRGAEETPSKDTDAKEEVRYVTMNVPYTDFYAAYNLTDQAVWEVEDGIDAVSTATTTKFMGTTGLAKGTYNNGKYIMGVTIPVKVSAETYENLKADLTATDNYYFTDIEGTPAAYSELTVEADGSYSFSKFENATISPEGLGVIDLDLNGGYGDYQISLDGITPDGNVTVSGETVNLTTYGAILNTDSGSYGMTALENLWFGTRVENLEIAWSIIGGQGLCRAHGKGDPYYQFDMNGDTLSSVTLITDQGLINIECDIELPEYYTGDLSELTYAITNDSKELSISGIPEDLQNVRISVSGGLAANAEVVDGKVPLNSEPEDGISYTLTISSSNYPDITRTMSTPISDVQKERLKELIGKAETTTGYDSNADLKEHVAEAEEMIADGTATSAEAATLIGELEEKIKSTYPRASATATLKGSELAIALEDVALESIEDPTYVLTYKEGRSDVTLTRGDLTGLTILLDKEPTVGTEYTLTIVSGNYQDIVTTVTAEVQVAEDDPVEINTVSLEKAIAEAEALNKADYTVDSWEVLQAALTNAKDALNEKESQDAVDKAADTLNSAIAALEKAYVSGTNQGDYGNQSVNGNQIAGGNQTAGGNQITNGNKNQDSKKASQKAAKTSDPSNIMGLLALAVSSLGAGGITLKRRRKEK